MTTGQIHGEQWGHGARDWATYVEPYFHSLYTMVHDRIQVGEGTRLLDVGCGPGGSVALACVRVARVAGLDASSGSIAVARERVPSGDFQVGDMESLPWPNGAFDAVTGFNSFQFASNPTNALAEARRVLAAGGRLGMVIWAPKEMSEQPRIMGATTALAPPQPPNAPGPFVLSSPGVVDSVLEAAGWRVVDRGNQSVVLEYPNVESACRAAMAGSGAVRAIQHSGEERVRQVILDALSSFRTEAGTYRMHNTFHYVIAK